MEKGLGLGQRSPAVDPQLGCCSPVQPLHPYLLLAVTTGRQAIAAGPSLSHPLQVPGGSEVGGQDMGSRTCTCPLALPPLLRTGPPGGDPHQSGPLSLLPGASNIIGNREPVTKLREQLRGRPQGQHWAPPAVCVHTLVGHTDGHGAHHLSGPTNRSRNRVDASEPSRDFGGGGRLCPQHPPTPHGETEARRGKGGRPSTPDPDFLPPGSSP